MLHTVRVENTRNTDINTVLTVVAIGQGFSDTLSFVIACTVTNRVDMTPAEGDVSEMRQKAHTNGDTLVFGLRMNLRVSVHLCNG